MSLPKMNGNYPLTKAGIDAAVKSVSPGAYMLGYAENNTFYVQRTGRSDVDVNDRLHDYDGSYKIFQFTYCISAQDAFLAECELWHAYANQGVQIHPDRPEGTRYACPVKGCVNLI